MQFRIVYGKNMKIFYLLLLIPALYISCHKDDVKIQEDVAIGVNWINVKSSSYKLPLNEYGFAVLTTTTNFGDNITAESEFYVNDQKIDKNIFMPSTKGTYKIQSVYKNLKSNSIEIEVGEPLNKKVLIEFFTSRICGFCPWIGIRLDSLQTTNRKVISYSIHGQDELEVNGTQAFQEFLHVYDRPAVRIERGYVRNYAAPIEIKGLIDSVKYFLSVQPKVEISIQSSIQQNILSIKTFCKYYEEIKEEIYLTLVLVEDGVITHNQYNYFSGYSHIGGPFISLPNPIPEYNNHNVLRSFLSDPLGDTINKVDFEYNVSQEIGSFEVVLEKGVDPLNSWIIAIVHKRRDDIEISSVLNSQIVKAGEVVGFND